MQGQVGHLLRQVVSCRSTGSKADCAPPSPALLHAGHTATLLFFVSPHSLLAALADACAVLGLGRRCCVARELTKLHEEFWRGSLEGALAEFTARGPRGEVTLVIEGAAEAGPGPEGGMSDEDILAALQRAVGEEGLSPSQAAKQVAKAQGLPRKQVYALSLRLDREGKAGAEGAGDAEDGAGA